MSRRAYLLPLGLCLIMFTGLALAQIDQVDVIAKSDPNDYGRIESFVMPEDQQVIGPAQVDG